MVLFGGIAAEALVYGETEGGENDKNLFRSICLLLEPPLSVAKSYKRSYVCHYIENIHEQPHASLWIIVFQYEVLEGTRDVTLTVLKSSTGLEDHGVDLRPQLAVVLGLAMVVSLFLGRTCLAQSFEMGELEARKLKFNSTDTEALLMGILVEGLNIVDVVVLLAFRRGYGKMLPKTWLFLLSRDKAILSGADNRPPMLEKDMYDSWKSRMELCMLNKQHGKMILESVEHGPLLWPTVEEDGVTRLKKYSELSAAEAIQADCDVKETNIILQGLPLEFYALVST
nr:hypothetical protein L195_g020321 [Tanacetum cinerariifolium]